MATDPSEVLFEALTPLDIRVRLTRRAWNVICNLKHPVMTAREREVEAVVNEPGEIRRSRVDRDVYLFYGRERPGRWLCVVVKLVNGTGFVITCYPTDAIKIGEQVWMK